MYTKYQKNPYKSHLVHRNPPPSHPHPHNKPALTYLKSTALEEVPFKKPQIRTPTGSAKTHGPTHPRPPRFKTYKSPLPAFHLPILLPPPLYALLPPNGCLTPSKYLPTYVRTPRTHPKPPRSSLPGCKPGTREEYYAPCTQQELRCGAGGRGLRGTFGEPECVCVRIGGFVDVRLRTSGV
jgi:hypothetical protein